MIMARKGEEPLLSRGDLAVEKSTVAKDVAFVPSIADTLSGKQFPERMAYLAFNRSMQLPALKSTVAFAWFCRNFAS